MAIIMTDKNWSAIIWLIIIVVGLLAIFGISRGDTTKGELQIDGKMPTFYDFHTYFFEGSLTDMQREEEFKKIENTSVTWEFYVKDVSNSGEYQVLGLKDPPKEYNIGSDIGVSFKSTEKGKLVNYFKGDRMKVQGRLTKYGNIANSKIFYIDNAVIINN